MHSPKRNQSQSGAAMLGIVLIVVLLVVILVMGLTLGPKLQNISDERKTSKRASEIVESMKQYYVSRQELPKPESVPVSKLNLEQEYKYDAWGQEWEYHVRFVNDDTTDITGIEYDGQRIAGVLISGGPDQNIESQVDEGEDPWEVTEEGDDIVIPLNVDAEAKQIARDELEVLRQKLWSYACANPAAAMPEINHFGLGDSYKNDPWSNRYILSSTGVRSKGPDGIEKTSDDIFLSALSKDCPDGLSPLTTPIAKSNFDDIDTGDKKVSFGTDEGTWESSDDLYDSLTQDTPNRSASSLELDGNDYITIDGSSHNSKYDFSLDQPFSLSIWVKFQDSGNDWVDLISKYEDSGYQLIRHNDGFNNQIYFFLASDTSQNEQIRVHGETNLMDNNNADHWHFVTVTYDAECDSNDMVTDENIKIYIDGREDNTQAESPGTQELDCNEDDVSISNEEYVRISGRADGQGNLDALIDDPAIYDKALDAEEVRDLYKESAVLWYTFQNQNAYDYSRTGNRGEFVDDDENDGNWSPTEEDDFVENRFEDEDQALQFNENTTSQWIDMGDDESLNFADNNDDPSLVESGFSIGAWFKTNDDEGPILSMRNDDDGGPVIDFTVGFDGAESSPGDIMGLIREDDQPTADYSRITGNEASDGKWHFAVLTRENGNQIKLYLDGIDMGDADLGADADGSITTDLRALASERRWLQPGGVGNQDQSWFSGTIDDVIIFPRNISQEEVMNEWCEYKDSDDDINYGEDCN